jgi:hypothetical protein
MATSIGRMPKCPQILASVEGGISWADQSLVTRTGVSLVVDNVGIHFGRMTVTSIVSFSHFSNHENNIGSKTTSIRVDEMTWRSWRANGRLYPQVYQPVLILPSENWSLR